MESLSHKLAKVVPQSNNTASSSHFQTKKLSGTSDHQPQPPSTQKYKNNEKLISMQIKGSSQRLQNNNGGSLKLAGFGDRSKANNVHASIGYNSHAQYQSSHGNTITPKLNTLMSSYSQGGLQTTKNLNSNKLHLSNSTNNAEELTNSKKQQIQKPNVGMTRGHSESRINDKLMLGG